jgi:hypothetical protein
MSPAGVMPLLGDLLKEEAFRVLPALQTPDLIGHGNELGSQFLDTGLIEDEPSLVDSVVSGATEWMAVHRPQQHR